MYREEVVIMVMVVLTRVSHGLMNIVRYIIIYYDNNSGGDDGDGDDGGGGGGSDDDLVTPPTNWALADDVGKWRSICPPQGRTHPSHWRSIF